MKIGYFITHFPYIDYLDNRNYSKVYMHGGAEMASYYLAINMAKNHEVHVFTTSINSKDRFESYDRIKVNRFGTNFRIGKGNISYKLFLKDIRHFDIIHAHFSTPPAELAALIAAKRHKIPLVLTYHGDWQENFGRVVRRISLKVYNNYLVDKVLSNADVIISPSEFYIKESLFLGTYRDKIVVIPNGVNIADFDLPYSKDACREKLGLPLDAKLLLFLGAISPQKGPDVLLKAMPKILLFIPNAKLVFAGNGTLKEELEQLSKDLGVEKNVEFVGFVEERMKPWYYKAADVFCLPSVMKSEVFPLVLLEASASGLPMVVSDLSTFKCIIEDAYNGIVTKRGDENDLADAIIYLLSNEEVRKELGKNARNRVEVYSWERIAEETEKVYNEVI